MHPEIFEYNSSHPRACFWCVDVAFVRYMTPSKCKFINLFDR